MQYFDSGARYDSGICYDEPVETVKIKPTRMRDLHIWLTNPFDDPAISMAELLAFTSDHLQRMMANSLTVLTPRIAATTTALNGVSGTFTDDETKLGLRKARKLAKNHYREALPAAVGKIAVAVEAKFGEGSAEFVECFPHGRAVFGKCPDDEVANNLQILINGVTAHQPPLDVQVKTDATALLTGWTAVFTPSETSTGAKTTTQQMKNTARAALQLELFKNLLTLALNFPRQPEQLDLYMQQSLLQPHTQTPAPPAPATTPTTEP
jgi:hypothetical protein